jgi:hypothetical protein
MSSSCASRPGTRTQKIPSRVLSHSLTLDSAVAKRGCRPACATVVRRPGPVDSVDRPALPHTRAVAPSLCCPPSISSRHPAADPLRRAWPVHHCLTPFFLFIHLRANLPVVTRKPRLVLVMFMVLLSLPNSIICICLFCE